APPPAGHRQALPPPDRAHPLPPPPLAPAHSLPLSLLAAPPLRGRQSTTLRRHQHRRWPLEAGDRAKCAHHADGRAIGARHVVSTAAPAMAAVSARRTCGPRHTRSPSSAAASSGSNPPSPPPTTTHSPSPG